MPTGGGGQDFIRGAGPPSPTLATALTPPLLLNVLLTVHFCILYMIEHSLLTTLVPKRCAQLHTRYGIALCIAQLNRKQSENYK